MVTLIPSLGRDRFRRRTATTVVTLLALLLIGVQPALAQSDRHAATTVPVLQFGILDGLGDIIVGAITELLRVLLSPIQSVIENHADALLEVIVQTPHPDAVFGPATNGPGPTIHEYYWETIVPLSLGLTGCLSG